MRPQRPVGPHVAVIARRLAVVGGLFGAVLAAGVAHPQQESEAEAEVPSRVDPPPADLAILPFRIYSAQPLGSLADTLYEDLAAELESSAEFRIVDPDRVRESLGEFDTQLFEPSDASLRRLAERLAARAVVTGTVTELAGRFSLGIRVIPSDRGVRSHSLVFTAGSADDLLGQVDDVAERVLASFQSGAAALVNAMIVEGAGEIEGELLERLQSRAGRPYDSLLAREDRQRLESHPGVASVNLETERSPQGVTLRFRVVRSEMIFGASALEASGELVSEIRIRGNRRIDAEAIRTRIRTRVGDPLRPAQLAGDVREVFSLGFFRNVRVFAEQAEEGRVLIFEVEENPVVRQIAISGNDKLDSDKIRDALTLTTGSTLDYALLYENRARIEALYRAEGFYLARVGYEIETIAEGSVAINFEAEENEKLRLRKILFIGNEAFSDDELSDDFATRRWRFWSYLTSWFDKSGTYSEPVFLRDLRTVEKKYSDAGYLQAEIGEPQVEPAEDGLVVSVRLDEGPRFRVGEIAVAGDESIDFDALHELLQLEKGEVFNRSHLTEDVEALERYYTDRGFYFASVQPDTQLSQEAQEVDVDFRVRKGPLYFIRKVNISGNTRTIDKVIRREMRAVEGQLYSARALQVSNRRVRQLGYFEDVSFEPRPTEDPSQLDLHVNVVERPTGSLSFGAGFSSQDRFVFTASLAQTNLFGRGYAVNLSADIGGRSNRFSISAQDPYFLGSSASLGVSVFFTDVRFEDFEQQQRGIDISLGHSLREDNTARGFLRYNFSSRKIDRDDNVNAAAIIFRELQQGRESTSLVGVSFRSDTRDDRLAPTKGTRYGATLEYAGLGGFSQFLRLEGRYAWYMGAPRWLFDRSTFVLSTRVGYVAPFNSLSDYDFGLGPTPLCDTPGECDGIARLDQIDTDLKLPLTERYFLGGIGSFQLRGYRGRSVGPRRAILRRSGLFGGGDLFLPVGTQVDFSDPNVTTVQCNDQLIGGLNPNQGNLNMTCNDITDRDIDDFEDLDETDVIGGNKFIASSLEYRFPISEEVGLQGVIFADGGNAFAEGDSLFDPAEWRYGAGFGVMWFSPFGPLQLVLGFPIDPLPIEDSPVFEFSVGGVGL